MLDFGLWCVFVDSFIEVVAVSFVAALLQLVYCCDIEGS